MIRVSGLIWFLIIFGASTVHAAIEPVRSSQYLDYVQYEVQRRVSSTYKQSIDIVRVASGTVSFREIFACGPDTTEPTSRFDIKREVSIENGERKIYEELTLTRCRDHYSVFRMIRWGDSIVATDDAVLLRGTFPKTDGARRYDLSVATGNIKFTFEQRSTENLIFASIVPGGGSPMQYQLNYVEQTEPDGSFAQTVRVQVLNGRIVVDALTFGYSWRSMTQGKNVPRQYLYQEGKEVAPKDYLMILQDIYGNGVFLLIGPALLATFPNI